MKNQKTFSLKPADVQSDWFVVDADGMTLGRLATQVATKLTGKDKPTYTPHVLCGDKVVVINAAKVKVTGNKLTDKMYYRHSGYPGGIKSINLADQLQKDARKVIIDAVRGMLPKNKLTAPMLKNLKVYVGTDHNHSAQQPKPLTLSEK
ncbi:50S ribosomal protein L13 [bacterium]|nr:50S ribosomal protein L13 [bacterium]